MSHPAKQINRTSCQIVNGEYDEAIFTLTNTLKTLKLVLWGDATMIMMTTSLWILPRSIRHRHRHRHRHCHRHRRRITLNTTSFRHPLPLPFSRPLFPSMDAPNEAPAFSTTTTNFHRLAAPAARRTVTATEPAPATAAVPTLAPVLFHNTSSRYRSFGIP
jgi:hypothetical protein